MSRALATLFAVSFPSLALAGVTAEANGPYTVAAESSVTMSATGSATSLCTGTSTYRWDFDGDGTYDTVASASTSASYTASGVDGPASYTSTLLISNPGLCTGATTATDTATTTVTNVNPTITSTSGSTSTIEGTEVTYGVVYADVEAADTHTFAWEWDDGSSASTSASAAHTFGDQGTYSLTVTVTDDDGGEVQKTFSVVVTNVAPQLTSNSWPSTGDEGATLAFSATATDPGADTLTYAWTFGDGDTATGADTTHAYADQGSFGVTLTVSDGDGGSDSASGTIDLANVAPEVTGVTGGAAGFEGQDFAWAAVFTDGGSGDTHTITWDFGDGSTATGASATHAYADEGTYAASVEVCDDDGACDTYDYSVDVTNAEPVVDEIAGPATGFEGDELAFDCVASDAGTADVLSYVWDFDDGGSDVAASTTHAWDDDGAYVLTCTVTDDDAAEGTATFDLVLANANPAVVGTPATDVIEGDTYAFSPGVDDAGVADTHTWSLSGPSGMTIDASTQKIAWTPGWEAEGSHTVRLTVDDDDGGRGTLEWALVVSMKDADADGMSDLWETEVGLDPADSTDGSIDPDGDARTNLDEWALRTDPFAYDGPGTPVAVSPLDGSEVASEPVSLVVANATSPVGETLVYQIELYDDAAMTSLLSGGYDLAEGATETSWEVDVTLTENTWYWWWAAAEDTWTTGSWSVASGFFFNTVNEAPGAPTVTSPMDGGTTTDTTPVLIVQEAPDADEDVLVYSFRLYDDTGAEYKAFDDILGDGVQASWTPDDALPDESEWCWEAWATDPDGLVGPSTGVVCFAVDTTNEPPTQPIVLEPTDGGAVASLTPTITVEDGVDPEGRNTWHRFELDTSAAFGSADLQVAEVDEDDGDTTWTPAELVEGTEYHLRVLSTDGAASSDWAEITFRVDAINEPPATPALFNPAEGASWAGEALEIVNATDPEGGELTYDFAVLDSGGAEVDGATGVIEDASGYTSWTPDPMAPGAYTWTARAVDDAGGVSDWAEARGFEVMGEDDTDRDVDTDVPDTGDDEKKGCGCSTGGSSSGVVGLGLLLLAIRRRK